MANFIFHPIKVAMCDGSGDFNWMDDEIVGVLYDNRINVGPNWDWTGIASYAVSTSGNMSGRTIGPDGSMRGSTLEFLGVTTQPGLRIRGMILKFVTGDVLIANFTDGLDGFSGNTDLAIEAVGLDIYARTSASNNGTWIKL